VAPGRGAGAFGVRATETDLVVVGAGTTGLTLALQAHDHGARVTVLERREECSRPSRALIVHPRTLEVLRPLGVTDQLLARGNPAASVHLHLGRRAIRTEMGHFPLADTAFPYLLIEAQARVEAVLSEALAARGVEVARGAELVEVHPHAEGVQARVRVKGRVELVDCRYLTGCDGPASTVRSCAGVGWPGGAYRQEVVLADVELATDLEPMAAHAVAGPTGVVFLFPLGERATWRLLSTRPSAHRASDAGGSASQPNGPVTPGDLQALLDQAGVTARLSDVAWSARVPLEHRLAASYRVGPLFLAGDAAHVHSPAGGQGMNTGIQDATNLGWKLAFASNTDTYGASVPETLLDSYEAERRAVARRVIALTHLLFWGEAATDPVASFVRATLVPYGAPMLPWLLRRRRLLATGIRVLSQLGVRYRGSPICLAGERPSKNAPHPGTRLGDEGVIVDGRQHRLHELIARPGVHLLLEHHAPQLSDGLLGPHIHTCRIENWVGRGLVAVRPDGYVGYSSTIALSDEIRSWLATIGAVPNPREARPS
jgi:2-polyprenyl-6-methoxyphenol hydroxylase-like FAD-dependent oxidoreductase